MKQHIKIIRMGRKRFRCRDIGCEDFDKAKDSRFKVANKLWIIAYLLAEDIIRYTPRNEPLPKYVPQNERL